MKGMNNNQLFAEQQKKLKSQDKDIDEIIGYTKEGKEINKELKTELLKQNRQLDDIDTDVILFSYFFHLLFLIIFQIDKVDKNLGKTKAKFVNFIKSTSNCSLMTMIVLEIIILLAIILFW